MRMCKDETNEEIAMRQRHLIFAGLACSMTGWQHYGWGDARCRSSGWAQVSPRYSMAHGSGLRAGAMEFAIIELGTQHVAARRSSIQIRLD